jgi:hypothetical protein
MVLSAGLALAMTVGFVVLPAFASQRDRTFGFIVTAWIGVIVCGGISLTNIIGASMGQRLATSADAGDAVRKRADGRKIIARDEAELATIGTVRSSATIQADIDAKLTTRRDLDGCEAKWLPSSIARSVCIEVHRLRAEKAKSDHVAELTSEIAHARAAINDTAASATVGSGDTAAIIAAARRFGWELEGETVDLVKSVGLAMGVELFAALLFVAWERSREGQLPVQVGQFVPAVSGVSVPSAPNETQASPGADHILASVPALECPIMPRGSSLAGEASQMRVPVSHSVPEQAAAADDAVMTVLRARGGTLLASQRTMAELFGMSRSSVNRVLHGLAEAGLIKLVTTAKGTAVELIEPKTAAA